MINLSLSTTDLSPESRMARYCGFKVCMFFLWFALYGCNSNRPSIGEGVFSFEPDSDETIRIYPSPRLISPSFEISADFTIGKARLYMSSYLNDSIKFSPLSYGQLLGYFSVRVIRVEDGWLQVVTNEQTGSYGWIAAPLTEVESWDTFLSSIHHINSMDGILYKSPGSKGILNSSGNYCFNLIDIQEDWLKVHHNADKCDDETTWESGPEGFIRWKRNGKLLIHFRM